MTLEEQIKQNKVSSVNFLNWNFLDKSKYSIYNFDNLSIAVSGESFSKQDFLIADTNLYIFDYNFKLKYFISNEQIANFLNITEELIRNINFTNFIEIKENVYGVIVGGLSVIYSCYCIFEIINTEIKLITKFNFDYTKYNLGEISFDMHCCKYLGDNHIILVAEDINTLPSDLRASKTVVIQEQKDGKVIWEWKSVNHLELHACGLRGINDDPRDTLHPNFLEVIDNKIIISFRNTGIACINKDTNDIEWIIGYKRNDLNFKHLPLLQHCILLKDKNHFLTFSNNWNYESAPIKDILNHISNKNKIPNKLSNCSIIEYNLLDNTSKEYIIDIPSTPRQGSLSFIKDNIYDINYGNCMHYDPITENLLFSYGYLEERNLDDNNVNLKVYFSTPQFQISRGL